MWKNSILDLFFPKFCLNCNEEGSYLCQDCFALIDILKTQPDPFLYCAALYDNFVVKKLINQFKYEPYIKELAGPLSSLIIAHLLNLEKFPDFRDFVLVPVPLYKKKLKHRGFNQAEELAKELAKFLKIPIIFDALLKIKNTPAQVELKKEQRQENIKGAFLCQKPKIIQGRKILLVDDIYTTGATMQECKKCLKEAGADVVLGICVARG